MTKKTTANKGASSDANENTGTAETKAPKQSGKPPTDSRREPNPASKKYAIWSAGRDGKKGSVKALAAASGTTESNIRQHIAQCHTVHGYGYTMSGDEFTIDGDTTETWADQLAAKATAKAAKDAEQKANEPDAGADAGADDGSSDAGSDGDDFL